MTETPQETAERVVEEWYAAQDKPLRLRDKDRLKRAFSAALTAERAARTAAEEDNAALRVALAPFARLADKYASVVPDDAAVSAYLGPAQITLGDLRRARAILAPEQEQSS